MSRNKNSEETVSLILDTAQRLFLEKGYENTTVQDIINALGGLSKGAIYHHFRSKEDILNAVGDRLSGHVMYELKKVSDDNELNGHEKLKKMFEISLSGSDSDIFYVVAPNFLENPKLLAMQIHEIFSVVAPKFVQPIIEQGIEDGSIRTEYPKELSEVIVLLANIWLNPMVIEAGVDELSNRVRLFDSLLKSMGLNLLDDKMMDDYIHYCRQYYSKRK